MGRAALSPGAWQVYWLWQQLPLGEGLGPHALRLASRLSQVYSCPTDNHDIISMKLFQLMVEHTPDEESIDWTKIEPSVNFLKSPKGACVQPRPAWAWAA